MSKIAPSMHLFRDSKMTLLTCRNPCLKHVCWCLDMKRPARTSFVKEPFFILSFYYAHNKPFKSTQTWPFSSMAGCAVKKVISWPWGYIGNDRGWTKPIHYPGKNNIGSELRDGLKASDALKLFSWEATISSRISCSSWPSLLHRRAN